MHSPNVFTAAPWKQKSDRLKKEGGNLLRGIRSDAMHDTRPHLKLPMIVRLDNATGRQEGVLPIVAYESRWPDHSWNALGNEPSAGTRNDPVPWFPRRITPSSQIHFVPRRYAT